MLSQTELVKLRKLFAEIVSGSSIYLFEGRQIFIKHLNLIDDLETDFYYQNYYNNLLSKGIFTEKQQLDYLLKNGLWEEEKEKQIENSKNIIGDLYTNKRKVFRFSEIESYEHQIKEEEEFLTKLLIERGELIGECAESLAQKATDLLLLQKSFYLDSTFKTPIYSEQEFADLDLEQTDKIFNLYRTFISDTDENQLKSVVIQPFFTNIFYLSESINDFFAIAISKLTHLQNKLITWARYFQTILQQPDIPQEILGNWKKIEDWHFGKQNVEKIIEKHEDNNGQLSLTISKDEMKFYGLNTAIDPNAKIAEATQKNSNMSFEDIIRAGIIPITERD